MKTWSLSNLYEKYKHQLACRLSLPGQNWTQPHTEKLHFFNFFLRLLSLSRNRVLEHAACCTWLLSLCHQHGLASVKRVTTSFCKLFVYVLYGCSGKSARNAENGIRKNIWLQFDLGINFTNVWYWQRNSSINTNSPQHNHGRQKPSQDTVSCTIQLQHEENQFTIDAKARNAHRMFIVSICTHLKVELWRLVSSVVPSQNTCSGHYNC